MSLKSTSPCPGILILLAAILGVVVPLCALAQEKPELVGEGFQMAIETRLVQVYATVTGARDKAVDDLTRDDFMVLEDGKSQEIVHFAHEQTPLSIILLVDSSESMLGRMDEARRGLADFIGSVRPIDQVMLMEFDHEARTLSGFTNDKGKLKKALEILRPDGSTALYDALALSIDKLAAREHGRVVVLLSDGMDASFTGGSVKTFEQVLRQAHVEDTRVFTIGLGVSIDRDELQRLADETGGEAYFSMQPGELSSVYREIGRELHNQYLLSYQPKEFVADGRWRNIEVKVRRSGLSVIARKGYYALAVP
jgi:Ca-activated chloride channel family protein